MTDQKPQEATPKQIQDVLVVQLAKTLQRQVTPAMLEAVAHAVSAFADIRRLGELEQRVTRLEQQRTNTSAFSA